ncbi:MAG: glutamyl-tRNA amidotransferase [candidate division Zixibacteria bacterium SM23_73]|nr:MAG: glutamyl-tRNA amidotransferase [candidate division Zixibacteria bacterium SM23_73]
MDYESIIGLEVHAQLSTESKIFCGCSTRYGSPPNTQTCPVCLGMPGVLPVLNKEAVEYAIKMVLAIGGKVNPKNIFARKNYFYPDLPKGYQISQYEQPLATGGFIEIQTDSANKKIGITRIHLEEDAGKSLHPEDESTNTGTSVDMNRCGVPLIEIVSEPDINFPQEAYLYLNKLKQIVQYLGICSGNMEEGALRCDANVSVRQKGTEKFGVNTEIKNMNSFKAVEKALGYEIKRQIGILKKGGTIEKETLLWDEKKQKCFTMRTKEESHDYRYFPEPDLVTLAISDEWINQIKKTLPELPDQKKERFVRDYKIPQYDAEILTSSKEIADYYEECVKNYSDGKKVSNWMMGEVLRELNQRQIEIKDFKIVPKNLTGLLKQMDDGTISGKMAKEIFAEMAETGKSASRIIKEKGLTQITDESNLTQIIETILNENEENVKKYHAGKEKLFGFFVGEVMKKTQGKANPNLVNQILKEKLSR